jgi:Tfp pilus assembly protein PilE
MNLTKKDFTIIEVIVLIAVIAALAGMLVPAILHHKKAMAEDPAPPLFSEANEMSRFTISMEHTPGDMPNIYLIKDSQTSNEWLFLTYREYSVIRLIPKP